MVEENNKDKEEQVVTVKVKQSKSKLTLIIDLVLALAIVVAAYCVWEKYIKKKEKPEIITQSSIESIIDISELSTLQVVYNGVAQGMNKKDPDKVDYYVSYNAIVDAGIDFSQLKTSVTENEGKKEVLIIIPKVKITDISVDAASMSYMFMNKKANTETVATDAYKICLADARLESEQTDAIFSLAEQNTENAVRALVEPFIDQAGEDCTLTIIQEGADDEN